MPQPELSPLAPQVTIRIEGPERAALGWSDRAVCYTRGELPVFETWSRGWFIGAWALLDGRWRMIG